MGRAVTKLPSRGPDCSVPESRLLSKSPLPRRLQLVRGAAVAEAMLGPFDAGVVVIVAQVPQIVRADPRLQRGQIGNSPRSMRRANWARRRRWVGPYIVRWRAFFTSRWRSRSAATIAADFACPPGSASIALDPPKSGGSGGVWVEPVVVSLKNDNKVGSAGPENSPAAAISSATLASKL